MAPLFIALALSSAALLIGAAVVAWQGLHVKNDLEQARTALQQAESAVTVGDASTARAAVRDAAKAAGRADRRSSGVIWSLYGHLPLIGAALEETRGVAREASVVAGQALPPLIDSLHGQANWQGRADLPALEQLAPPLVHAAATVDASQRRLAALPYCRVAKIDDARESLSGSVRRLAADVDEAAVAAQVVPPLLGADSPTRLLVVTQNLAEERATGGLLGAYALLRADRGHFVVEQSGTDADLIDAATPVVDLGTDFRARYGLAQATSTWRSANLTPDVPSAGAILAGLSARQLGKKVDAVVFVDPVALSKVLAATGPVEVPGLGALNVDNAVPLLLRDVYASYSRLDQQPQRKAALRDALDAVVARLQRPLPGGGLARALARAAATGHLQVYATDPQVEALMAGSQFSGSLPTSGPFLSLVTQDVGGSKLDYYLHRSISYVATPNDVAVDLGAGPETVEDATVTITLRNDAPTSGLPPYVTARADAPALSGTGQLRSWVSLYLGPRSTYSDATLNGKPVGLSSQAEKGLSVLSTYVSIDPGATVTLVLHVQQPSPLGAPLLWRQQPRLLEDALDVRRAGAATPRISAYAP